MAESDLEVHPRIQIEIEYYIYIMLGPLFRRLIGDSETDHQRVRVQGNEEGAAVDR